MSCFGCNNDHVDLSHTWCKSGSLTRGNWMPFGQPDDTKEGYDCQRCGQNNNSSARASWTKWGNVTPYNSNNFRVITDTPTKYNGTICNDDATTAMMCGSKENYGYVTGSKTGDYVTLNHTWGKWSSKPNHVPKTCDRVGV